MARSSSYSPSEPVSVLRHIPIVECHEPLVDYLALCPALQRDEPVYAYRRESLLRRSVAERLCEASRYLPEGYRFAVLEGWRGRHIQHRMYQRAFEFFRTRHPDWSETKLKRTVNTLTAPPDHPKVPPPHLTGGAMDIGLTHLGVPCDFHSPYERSDPTNYATDSKGLGDVARRHRALLVNTLARVDITNYPSEYWHFSYGDQGWAYRGGHSHAIYGAIEPDAWTPDPDDLEGPLIRVR